MVQKHSIPASKPACFDKNASYLVEHRRLPHWSQNGTACFLTFRTNDSIPRSILEQILGERARWLVAHGIDWRAKDWMRQVASLSSELRSEFDQRFRDRWELTLDDCHGECVLKRPELSRIVERSLQHFDGKNYDLSDYVVMPNHVHVLAAFYDAASMLGQCESWKHFTAREINRELDRRGKFWQSDGFDHLVRSPEQFDALRRYIAENPIKARLRESEFRHFSRKWT